MSVSMSTWPPRWLVPWAVARTRGTPAPHGAAPGPVEWEWLRYAQWRLKRVRDGDAAPKTPRNVRSPVPRAWYRPLTAYLAEMERDGDEDDRSPVERFAANIVYCVSDPLEVARLAPPKFKIFLCADPNPDIARWATEDSVRKLRESGRVVGSWVGAVRDPYPTGEIRPRAYLARQMAERLGLDAWAGQGETGAEFDDSLAEGARIEVGNANSWTKIQRDRAIGQITGRVLAHVQEVYTNVAGPWPEATGTQGVPVASYCIGLYNGSGDNPAGGRYVTAEEYRHHTPPVAWARISAYISSPDLVTAACWRALAG